MLHESSAQRIGALIIASESTALLNAYDAAPSQPRRVRAIACSVLFLWFALHTARVTGSLATSAPVSPRQDGSNQEVHGMQHKKRFVATAGAVALSLAGASAAQDAVEWRVVDGGNGHWYGRSSSPTTWDASQEWARAQGGNLASITSAAEISAVQALSDGCWIGARKLTGLPWEWADGEGWDFTNWCPGEPCCFDGGLYVHASPSGCWDDHNQSETQRFGLIEWSADCNNDGIVDFGQILAGELDDANHNNIPDCCEASGSCNCPGDVARDGVVNGIDLAAVLNNWGTSGGAINADANGDGIVDAEDLALVLGSWGDCP